MPLGSRWRALSERAKQCGSLYAQLPAALCESSSGEKNPSRGPSRSAHLGVGWFGTLLWGVVERFELDQPRFRSGHALCERAGRDTLRIRPRSRTHAAGIRDAHRPFEEVSRICVKQSATTSISDCDSNERSAIHARQRTSLARAYGFAPIPSASRLGTSRQSILPIGSEAPPGRRERSRYRSWSPVI
jgi:hypothetical protein